MKGKFISSAIAMGLVAMSLTWSQSSFADREMVYGVTDALIPGGFDSNSDTFVVVSGVFPNGCYSWKRADVTADNFTHEVRNIANVSEGMCLMVLVPFTKEVRLGRLAVGEHTIRFVGGDGTYMEKKVRIEE